MPNSGFSNNSLSSLAERMKAATEQQTQAIEQRIEQQLQGLSKSLSRSSKNALATTESAIQQQLTSLQQSIALPCRVISRTFVKRWLQTLLISGSILLGITLAGWGLFTLAQSKIVSLSQEITTLQAAKARIEQDYQQVATKFKGISLAQQAGKDYIVLPMGYKAEIGWQMGKQQAIQITKGR